MKEPANGGDHGIQLLHGHGRKEGERNQPGRNFLRQGQEVIVPLFPEAPVVRE